MLHCLHALHHACVDWSVCECGLPAAMQGLLRLQGFSARRQLILCFVCRIFWLSICVDSCNLPGMELAVKQKFVLYLNGKHCIPEQKCVDGDTYMHLNKWDRALVRTLTGKSLELRSGKDGGSLNIDMWDDMISARQQKANELLQQALNVEEDEATEKKKPCKKVQAVKALSKHALVLPQKFTISVQGHEFQVLFDGIGTKSVWIEMTEENLTWLKNAIDRSEQKPRKKRRTRKVANDEQAKSDDDKNQDSSSENK